MNYCQETAVSFYHMCVHFKFYGRYIAGDVLTVATFSKASPFDFQLHDVTSGNILGR